MITTEEIAIRVWNLLQNSDVKDMISGSIDYERNDYSKEDIVIVPHTIDGEGSVRFGEIKVNIHVPDLLKQDEGEPAYRIYFERLIGIRAKVIEVLKGHYVKGEGYNWTIGRLNPPIKEQGHNVHFMSLSLEITVRNK